MKKAFVLFFVLICAALSVLSVSAAPREAFYDQDGNSVWCNKDSYGCWVTDADGGQMYIMFWSEAARDYIMGPGSNAPITITDVYDHSPMSMRDSSAATPEPESSTPEPESSATEREKDPLITVNAPTTCEPKDHA